MIQLIVQLRIAVIWPSHPLFSASIFNDRLKIWADKACKIASKSKIFLAYSTRKVARFYLNYVLAIAGIV